MPRSLCCSNGEQEGLPHGGSRPRTGSLAGTTRAPSTAPCLSCTGSAALGSGGLSKRCRLRCDSGWRPWHSGTRAASPGTTARRLQSQLEPPHPAGHPPLQRAPPARPAALLCPACGTLLPLHPPPILGPSSPGGPTVSGLFCPGPHLLPPLSMSTASHPSWPTSPSWRPPMGPVPAPPHGPRPYGTVPPVASEAASFWAQRDTHRKQD